MITLNLLRSVLLVLFLLTLGTYPAWSQNTADVALTVAVNPDAPKVNGQVLIQVVILNTREQGKINLRGQPGFGAAGGLTLVIEDADGRRRTIAPAADTLNPAQPVAGDRRVVLTPGQALGLQRREATANLFPAPGRYRLFVTYASPRPNASTTSSVSDAVEGASGTSNVVELVVE